MKTLTIIFVLTLGFTLPEGAEKGRYGADALNTLGPGAQAQALGGAYTAIADNATAIFWNPAGLTQVKSHQFYFSYVYLFEGLANYQFVALVIPLPGKAACAASWNRMGVDGIPEYGELLGTTEERLQNRDLRSSGEALGSFNDHEMIGRFSFAKSLKFKYLTDQVGLLPEPIIISLGSNMNWYRQVLYDFTGNYMAMDFGLLADIGLDYSLFGETPNRNLKVGIMLQNLLKGDLVWNTKNESRDLVPRITRLGLSYKEVFKQYNSTLVVSYQRDIGYTSSDHGGIEYSYNRMVYIRAGYGDRQWSTGAGFYIKRVSAGYTFKNHALEPIHITEISYDF